MEKYKKKIGNFGEILAKNFLITRNYTIIDSNIKLGYLEIDLIAREKDQLVFVEVKTRTSLTLGPAEDALASSQIKNLKRAISIFCARNRINLNKVRLDFIAIDLNIKSKLAKIKHFKDII